MVLKKAGGYYLGKFSRASIKRSHHSSLDVGTSQLIIDGKIKLKSNGPIASFTPTGLLFKDGSTLDASVVVFATGYVLLAMFRFDDLVTRVIVV